VGGGRYDAILEFKGEQIKKIYEKEKNEKEKRKNEKYEKKKKYEYV
jgi:cytoskeletal protein RodZ